MPTADKNLRIFKFKTYEKSLHIPHVIYADLEAMLKKH